MEGSQEHFRPEILAPAGQLDKLMTACRYGADAVYVGGPRFGLRSGADNFSDEELSRGIQFAKQYGTKVYVTLNAFLHEHDLDGLGDYAAFLGEVGVSALIISDPGVMALAAESCQVPLHVSTQASCLNSSAAEMWKALGAVRIITGRELSLEEGARIKRETGLEVEMFVHGAMCSAYSGQCTISNYTAGRDSNRGGCKQSCRFHYKVEGSEGADPKEEATLMSSKDLNGLHLVPQFMDLQIDSMKVEGRMKSSLYVASCCKAYREAVDSTLQKQSIPERSAKELLSFSNRGYTEASLGTERAGASSIVSNERGSFQKTSWLGQVMGSDEKGAWVQLKNPLNKGDAVEALTFQGENVTLSTDRLWRFDGTSIDRGAQESVLWFDDPSLKTGMVIRKGEIA
jgi:putative protease